MRRRKGTVGAVPPALASGFARATPACKTRPRAGAQGEAREGGSRCPGSAGVTDRDPVTSFGFGIDGFHGAAFAAVDAPPSGRVIGHTLGSRDWREGA